MSKTEKVTKSRSSAITVLTPKELDLGDVRAKNLQAGFSTWMRVLGQNWRQGTVSSQGRSDVSRTNKKPFKQKGTGRARAGSARSPLWKGGGVVFGPQKRSKTLAMPQKVKRAVLRNMLVECLDRKGMSVADWSLSNEKPSTAAAHRFLQSADLTQEKVLLLVSPHDLLTRASFRNIPNVRVVFIDQINALDLASCRRWVVLKKDVQQFKEMVAKWS